MSSVAKKLLQLAALLIGLLGAAAEASHYAISTTLDPAGRTLEATVTVELPEAKAGQAIEFLLAATLEITSADPAIVRLPADPTRAFVGINGSSESVSASGRAARYRVTLPTGVRRFTLAYRGRIDFGFETPGQEYARGFSETAGTINPQGVYLAGSTLWYPWLGEDLFTFDLSASAPAGWQLLSPGRGDAGDAQGRARWSSTTPIDELHIVGGPLTRYVRQAGAVRAEVYLRQADDALAAKYLESTARNLEMYRTLIGPYPYDKFALVENFWETGYGMPSFTLLGPQIIRFPFILTSSYPHEILHNWWGNGVFVDYAQGNWCEGLTAYHADHLYKEQLGQGADYRRDTLKKYRDFVREARDFPLVEFRSRHSPTTEAVGYGKSLMTWHMLRRRVGDDAYVRGLQRFYREKRGQRASFTDLANAHGAAAREDLSAFVTQWTTRVGAPQLSLADVVVTDGHRIQGELRQLQSVDVFQLDVPIVVRTTAGIETFRIASEARRTRFELRTKAEPIALEVDPEFDLFRLLDARETAPSLGQMFGEPEVLAIVPASASPAERTAYEAMIAFWSGGGAQRITVVSDTATRTLPKNKPVWIFGHQNLWAQRIFRNDAAIGFEQTSEVLRAGADRIPRAGHSAVFVHRHPDNPARAVTWVLVDPLQGATALARKLPHYGKYSWLGFAGVEASNMAKGEWPTADSPLKIDLRATSARQLALPVGGYPARAALARLPEVFDAEAMARDVRWLADPAREGRGLGTPGLEAAADYIAAAYRKAGLKAVTNFKDIEEYSQAFEFTPTGARQPVRARNLIGVLPGGDPRYAAEAIIVSAHYDHLGRSGPGVRMAEIGQIHPGADDNASGVAVLLELARTLVASGPPPRTIVFIAFAGEEAGLQGSRYFVANPAPVPLEGIRAIVNLDTVGRLGTGELMALATGTASEWIHVFRGIGFSTGITVKSVPGAAQSSDQQSFIERGIPGIQLHTGAHLDYHRPSDGAQGVDFEGLVKVATVARETVSYLSQRPGPLTVTIESAPASSAVAASAAPRRVSFGLVPDYAHGGAGVRAESVVPGSPAQRAGLQAGDVVLALDGRAITGLSQFSDVLKTFEAGQRIRTQVRRGSAELNLEVVLQER